MERASFDRDVTESRQSSVETNAEYRSWSSTGPVSIESDDESVIEGEETGSNSHQSQSQLSSEPSNPGALRAPRGRKPAEDGLVKPDTSDLSPISRARAVADFKRQKNRAAQRRLRQRRKEAQKDSFGDDEAAPGISKLATSYPVLAEMGNSGEVSRLLKLGATFNSKRDLIVAIRSVAEYLGRVDVLFLKSDNSKVSAHSESSYNDFNMEAGFSVSTGTWKIMRSSISTRKGSRPSGRGPRTAYQERDLAGMLRLHLKANPSEQIKPLRAVLKPYLRFADAIRDNQIFRARAMVLEDLHGRPDDNIKLLPVIKDEFERTGHRFGYRTIQKDEMVATLESVAKSEYKWEEKKLRKNQ